jgi:hypothetical protein
MVIVLEMCSSSRPRSEDRLNGIRICATEDESKLVAVFWDFFGMAIKSVPRIDLVLPRMPEPNAFG